MRFWPLVVLLLGLSACSSPSERAGRPHGRSTGQDSCEFARDGECDEPENCAWGTDTTDCNTKNQNNNNSNNNCTPNCGDRVCGNDPVCGMSCGSCDMQQSCTTMGECVANSCTPNCQGISCGPDPVCGMSCGSCDMEQSCNSMGQCVANSCTPDCQGLSCGPDPICGMSCGSCSGNTACNSSGQCVPTCGQGQTLCGSNCVNTQNDDNNCGSCGNSCSQGQTCQNGQCEGGMMGQDCRQTPCTGFTYCDLTSGNCLPGCSENSQCPMGQQCDVNSHQCFTPATNLCGSFCNWIVGCFPQIPIMNCTATCDTEIFSNCTPAQTAQAALCIANHSQSCLNTLACLQMTGCMNLPM